MIRRFGTLPGGQEVQAVTITAGDLSATVLSLGAILQDVRLAGFLHSLTLGAPDLPPYLGPMAFFGAIVGPVANRVGGASATIGGTVYPLEANEGGVTTLHSGTGGTHARLWTVKDHGVDYVNLALELEHLAAGLPGHRHIEALFAVEAPATLSLEITATTDSLTAFNFANHSYWTLDGRKETAQHRLEVRAERYLPTDALSLPERPATLAGTPFDLRKPTPLDPARMDGIDNNYCLSGARGPLRQAAVLQAPGGPTLTLETTEPGLQVYTATRLQTAPHLGHTGEDYGPFAGVALEAQGWPDALNNPEFPSILTASSDTYRQITQIRFT
ncbi:MAG: aldose epimerase family protein [Pseudomonadota bacterium]